MLRDGGKDRKDGANRLSACSEEDGDLEWCGLVFDASNLRSHAKWGELSSDFAVSRHQLLWDVTDSARFGCAAAADYKKWQARRKNGEAVFPGARESEKAASCSSPPRTKGLPEQLLYEAGKKSEEVRRALLGFFQDRKRAVHWYPYAGENYFEHAWREKILKPLCSTAPDDEQLESEAAAKIFVERFRSWKESYNEGLLEMSGVRLPAMFAAFEDPRVLRKMEEAKRRGGADGNAGDGGGAEEIPSGDEEEMPSGDEENKEGGS